MEQQQFGKAALAALSKECAFPELIALALSGSWKRKPAVADVAAFLAALELPRLRHLKLGSWHVGNLGAKVIAKSAAFAGLTRLDLSHCKIGDPGVKTLLASPHLQNLVELDLSHNPINEEIKALLDPAVMPRLGVCRLFTTKIPKRTLSKLRAAGRYVLA